ncbi:uncharacterized protein DNG_08408 [Cephalotrichum gorgonifer]|uniref:Uncharacterized protein n=1 Tax=Cephalotrichum gorgonifer TaxID=2041049 RepID=A0AAE8N3G3_9PEZI|nr:uncharacterized protein DNG_08408 [Cephalotrichum gorgonifer]
MSDVVTGGSGQFEWFRKIGATDEAIMTLNDQPILFTILLVVIVSLILESLLIWYIDYATRKPEQMKKKEDAKKGAGKAGGIKATCLYSGTCESLLSHGGETTAVPYSATLLLYRWGPGHAEHVLQGGPS